MTVVHVYRSQQLRPIEGWRCDDSLRCAVALKPVNEKRQSGRLLFLVLLALILLLPPSRGA